MVTYRILSSIALNKGILLLFTVINGNLRSFDLNYRNFLDKVNVN